MKRIKHESKIIHYGLICPWFIALAAVLIFKLLGFTTKNEAATMILLGVFAICAADLVIFAVLFIIEKIFGAVMIIENDHLDIRMLLRHKRLYFDSIVDAKYSHYYDNEDAYAGYDIYTIGPRLRSQLVFMLNSGKRFRLNDNAKGYEGKQNLWITDPKADPNENIKLYQAYRCFRSAYDRYYNSK